MQKVVMSSFVHVFFTDPPSPPNMTVVSSVLSLNVTWRSSVEESVIMILDYRIKVFDDNTLKRVWQREWITSSSLVIENLKRNRTYIVIIQARNEVGYGKSANITATTLLAGTTIYSQALSTRIRIFLNPQLFLSGFKNFPVHTHPMVFEFTLVSKDPLH